MRANPGGEYRFAASPRLLKVRRPKPTLALGLVQPAEQDDDEKTLPRLTHRPHR